MAEIFGPTVQGEGIDQGVPCYFVRFGGCDFKCEWCDSPHSVLPQNVRQLKRMSTPEILSSLSLLPEGPRWVVLSGGNPALHDLTHLVESLHTVGYKVAVETQGTVYKPWLTQVDRLCVSPKPPSSGMKYGAGDLAAFLDTALGDLDITEYFQAVFLKVVVFDNADYEFARKMYLAVKTSGLPFFLSAGNDAGATVGNPSRRDTRSVEQVRNDLLDKTRWLVNKAMVDPIMDDAKVQCQLHVALWGNELGR